MENSSVKTVDLSRPEINILVALRRHWFAGGFVAMLVFGAMAFKTLRQPGIYRSEALIVVSNQVSVPILQDTITKPELANNLPTEIEILQSPTLLNRAVSQLAPVYRTIPLWNIQQNLSLRWPEDTTVLSVSYQDTDSVRAKAILDSIVSTYIAYSEETRRSPVTNAINFIEERLTNLESNLENSSNALTAFRTKHSLDSPENSVSLAYSAKEELQQSLDLAIIEMNQLKETNKALKNQIAQLGQNPETSLADAVISQDNTYQSLAQQLMNMEVQYQLDQSRYTPEHPIMQRQKDRIDELSKLLGDEGQERQQVKSENSPEDSQLSVIQQDLASQLLENRLSLLAQEERVSGLRQQLEVDNQQLQKLLKLQQEYRELERKYQQNAQILDGFVGKLQELRVQEAQDTFTWKLIEPPNLPTIPNANSRIRGLVLGFIASALAGIGVAFFLEKIDFRLKEIGDVKEVTNLPILGIIPPAQTATAVDSQSSDSFTEAIRSLALTLSFQTSQVIGKAIVITSAIAGEGKTTITYNLGLALGELNKRVLIIDANLVNPSLHKVFGKSNSQGLTTAIAADKPWELLVQASSKQEEDSLSTEPLKIDILPDKMVVESKNSENGSPVFARVSTISSSLNSESIPPRPTTLFPDIITTGPVSRASFPCLVSVKLEQLIEQWRKIYDYVLIDTSYITGLADAQSLTPKVDEVILVVSLNRVERSQVTQTLEILRGNKSKIMGIVVNTTRRGKGKNHNYIPFS